MTELDKTGEMALFAVVAHSFEKSKPQVLRVLLRWGCSPMARNYQGETTLHRAAQLGDMEAISILLEEGVHPTEKDNDRVTPLDLARETSVKALLQQSRERRQVVEDGRWSDGECIENEG